MSVSPFYIEPRNGEQHIELDGQWAFTYEDTETDCPDFQQHTYSASLPQSTYYNLYEAGILGYPYAGVNAKDYLWVREKVWYYKKRFKVAKSLYGKYAVLCFDGVAYYSKVWLNGNLIAEHEGMFGGPFVCVSDYLNYGGENELLVEIKSVCYGDPHFHPRNNNRTNTQIAPWCASGDCESGSQDFMVIGIWRPVRIEFLEPKHLSRPYLTTEKIEDKKAFLRFETEISDGEIDELKTDIGINSGCYGYTRAFDGGMTGIKKDVPLVLSFKMTEKDSGKPVLEFEETVLLNDREKSGINPAYYANLYFEKNMVLDNPKLWYPHTMGEPFLYEINISLSEKGRVIDTLQFDSGIRVIKLLKTAGEKHRHRWGKFQFEINGRKIFLKGMNSMPVDFLYKEDEKDIKWTLDTAKNAGIELMRVWNGGGCPESDTFYSYCNSIGILVWQDWFIANTEQPGFPHDVLEEQMMLNLYRIRNNPSLAVHCGGNEFNPYAVGNAAAMYIMQRSIEDLDSERPFIRTTADGGSAHIYRDIEPIWFSRRYCELPFVGESGIHSFPNTSNLKRLLPESEYNSLENKLPDLFDRTAMEKYPAFLAHFVEYVPERIPRMIARASTITDVVGDISLSDFAEATQLASCEFYQMMIFSMRDNYPKTAGIMPWVFKRPWTTVGVQLVDGAGYAIAPYYAVKNAYESLGIMLRLPELVFAPGEQIPLTAVIFNDNEKPYSGILSVSVYSPDLCCTYHYETAVSTQNRKTEADCGVFCIPQEYGDTAFFITVTLACGEKKIRTVYWPKCLKELADESVRTARRAAPLPNPEYSKGPWLKETVLKAGKTHLSAQLLEIKTQNGRTRMKIRLKNEGKLPAFPVHIGNDDFPPYYLSDNYFLLEPGEEKEVVLTVRSEKEQENRPIFISGWNFDWVSVPQQ